MKIVFKIDREKYNKAACLPILKETGRHYYVKSEKHDRWYSVIYHERMRNFSCSCYDSLRRRNICKHIIAVIRTYAKNIQLEVMDPEPCQV